MISKVNQMILTLKKKLCSFRCTCIPADILYIIYLTYSHFPIVNEFVTYYDWSGLKLLLDLVKKPHEIKPRKIFVQSCKVSDLI